MDTALEAFERIRAEAKKSDTPQTRHAARMAVGEWVRQGDVNIILVSDGIACGKKVADRQLAPGTTQGSRHVIAADVDCEVFLPAGKEWEWLRDESEKAGGIKGWWTERKQALVYRIVKSKSRLVVEHPEHAHKDLPPGCYVVTGQMEHAEEVRRVAD